MDSVIEFLSGNILGTILFGYLFGSIPFGLILCAAFGYGDIRTIGSGNIGATNVLRTGNKFLALLTLILDSGKGVTAFIMMYLLAEMVFSSLSGQSLGDMTGMPPGMYPDPVSGLPIDIPGHLPSCAAVTCAAGAPCPCTNGPVDTTRAGAALVMVHADPRVAFTATVAAFSAVLGHMFPVWLKFKGGKGVATAFGAMLAATPITAALSLLIWVMSVLATRISSMAALSAALIAPVVSWIFYGDAVAIITSIVCVLVWIRHKDNILRIIKGTEPKIGDKKKSEAVNNEPDTST